MDGQHESYVSPRVGGGGRGRHNNLMHLKGFFISAIIDVIMDSAFTVDSVLSKNWSG